MSFKHDDFISKIMVKVLTKERFFASIAMSMFYKADESIPTAATDGYGVYYNPAFISSMTSDEQVGVMLHEILHAALCHVVRRGSRDPFIWNIAADIGINGQILASGYTLPKGCVIDKNLQDLATEEIYEKLIKEGKNLAQQQQNCSGNGKNKQKEGQNQGNQPGQCSGNQPGSGKGVYEHTYDHINKAYGVKKGEFVEDMIDSDATLSEDQKRQMKEEWRRRMQRAKMAGSTPAGMKREMDAFGASKIPWQNILRKWVVNFATDFTGYDRRFIYKKNYFDALDGEKLKVHCCVDTSGSVDNVVLGKFYTEVNSILRCYSEVEMDLYFCDTTLYGPYSITKKTAKPQAEGGGGTCFEPIFDALKGKRKELVIYLTDGYGSFPTNPSVETIWVVIEGGLESERFPFGRVIRMSE